MRAIPLCALAFLVGCSGSTGTGGGTGGTGGSGTGGGAVGGGTGGSGGGSAGGGTGGGSAGGTGGGSATGGGTGGAGGGTAGVTLANYCTKLDEATCAQAKRCGWAAPNADCAKVALPTRFSLINARTDCLFVDLRTSLTAGTTTFHGDKAAACLALTTSCNQNAQYLGSADCAGVFTGTKAVGATCRNTAECVPSAWCDSSLAVCPGTCQPRVAVGGFAPSTGACPANTLYMSQNDGGGTCQALVAPNGDCTPPPGAFFGKLCAGDSYCATGADGGRSSQALIPLGGACVAFSNENCAPGTTCAGGADGGTQCVAIRKSGDACSGSGLGIPCQTGLSCTGNLCAPLVAAGGSCFQDQDCAAGHVCGPGGLCRPFGGVDAGCTTANFQDDCGVGLFCGKTAGKCEPRRGRDALCPNGNECSIELGFGCNTPADAGPARCRPVACINP